MTPDARKDSKDKSKGNTGADKTVAPRVSPLSPEPDRFGQVLIAFGAGLFVLFVLIRIIVTIAGAR